MRGSAAVEIGPVTDEQACLHAARLQLEAAGYRAQIAGQHDKGWGYLLHGGADGQAAAVVLVWSTRYMQQGRLEIYFQREGLLPPTQPALALALGRFCPIEPTLERDCRWRAALRPALALPPGRAA